jgi:hypothetical protein
MDNPGIVAKQFTVLRDVVANCRKFIFINFSLVKYQKLRTIPVFKGIFCNSCIVKCITVFLYRKITIRIHKILILAKLNIFQRPDEFKKIMFTEYKQNLPNISSYSLNTFNASLMCLSICVCELNTSRIVPLLSTT